MSGSNGKERNLIVLSRSHDTPINGIRDHARALAAAVDATSSWSARALDLGHTRPRNLAGTLELGQPACDQTVLLEYNPFSFGHRGLAPWLPLALEGIRRSHPAAQLAVLVHEPFLPASSVKWALLHAAQRAQLAAVLRLADVRMATTEQWADLVPRGASVLPVGSNLPDCRLERNRARALLGVRPSTVVVAAFGTGHPGQVLSWIHAGIRGALEQVPDLLTLNLGAGVSAIAGCGRCITPGPLKPAVLAAHLAAADLFLAPFADGISTRRTTAMAALQHGLPILGTRGPATGSDLNDSDGLVILDGHDRDGFAHAAARLASDPCERARRGAAARTLYEERFAWNVLAERVIRLLGREAPE